MSSTNKGHLCRLCLRRFPTVSSLFANNLDKMLEILTSIKVAKNEPMTQVCFKCSVNLKLAFKIQQTIKEADKKLKRALAAKKAQFEAQRAKKLAAQKNPIKSKPSNSSLQGPSIALVDLTDDSKPVPVVTTTPRPSPSDYCLICGKCSRSSDPNVHLHRHFLMKKNCGPCDKTFETFEDFKEHIDSQHKKSPYYKCRYCDRTFLYESIYDFHVKNSHSAKKSGTNNAVSSGASSAKPAESKPDPSFQFDKSKIKKKCPICSKFYSSTNLTKHIEAHSSPEQICELCGAKLKNADGLRAHLFYSHAENRYKCDFCPRKFKVKGRRDCHMKRDHGGTADYVCDVCGKKFYTTGNLRAHIKMRHEKLRPYVCEFCRKAFSSKFALQTHRRQHTLEAPYKCELCGESFRQKVSLRSHKKSKHNIVEAIVTHCKTCGRGFSSAVALFVHTRKEICNKHGTSRDTSQLHTEEDLKEDVKEDVNQYMNQDVNQDINQDMNQDMIHGMNQDMIQDMNQDVNPEMKQGISLGIHQDIIEEMGHDYSIG